VKTKFLSFIFTVLAVALFAQTSLKDSVCLVAVGHVDYMASGSGFLVSDGEGNQYIVSNDHVTQQSGTLTVIFREEGGSMRRFENMTVLAYDALYDLSVLGFPMGRKINRQGGLKIDITAVDNKESVSAAGFPFLSWNISDGVILENNTPAYRSGTVHSFLTHSAFVDSGSSGGPLLRRRQDLHTGWAVIGVNTLKIKNGPGLSIPSGRIVELLNTAAAKKTENRILERDNGIREKAVRINFEDPVVSAAIKSPDYTGWYRFSADVKGDLEITFQSAESFNLELYDNGGKMLGSGTGSNFSFDAHISSGDHYLKATGDIVYWTTYNISANFKAFPDNYEHGSAVSPVPAKDGVWYSRVLHRNDEDWFSVSALPGKALIFETEGLNDSNFEVFDLTGTPLAESGSRTASVDSHRWIYTPDKAVTSFLVRVTGYNQIMGEYSFRVFQASVATANGIMENAVVITPRVPITGSVKNVYDRSWFCFSPSSRGTVLNITVEGGNFSLELYNSKNNLISRDDYSNSLSVSVPDEEVFLCIKAADFKTNRNNSFIVLSETD